MAGDGRHKYTAIPDQEPGETIYHEPVAPDHRRGKLRQVLVAVALLTASVLLFMTSYGFPKGACEETASCTDISRESWGQYSPFFWISSKQNQEIQDQCKVSFVQVLARHGSRGPTTSKLLLYAAMLARLQYSVTHYAKGFHFIKDYELDLVPDQLTWYGEKEMTDLGETLYKQYSDLAEGAEPFVRASGSDRVVASARNFTQGFYAAQNRNGADFEKEILVIPEADGYNNTLDHGRCAYFEDGPGKALGVAKQRQWKEKWISGIQNRLNEKLQNADLTLDETAYLMDLCPFITVSSPTLELSKFCSLFTQSEWAGYDYYQSLEKWYVYGPGRKLGPTQGVGFVNELIARLTGKAVDDHTTTNSTLDSSPTTYPLDRKIYADFSHDNTLMAIYSALGLYNGTESLPLDHIVPPRELAGYAASWAVPFGARMYVEKLDCLHRSEALVRVLVNGRVVSLQGCDADEHGRCSLSSFVESLSFARNGGRWGECQAEVGEGE